MKLLYGLFNIVIKFIGWLLMAFGLWVPIVYCFIFLLVCVFAGIPLSDASGVFYFGLLLSLIGSAMIIVTRPVKFLKDHYKGAKPKPSQNHQPARKRGQDVRPDYKDKTDYLSGKKRRQLDDYFAEEEYEEEEPDYAPPPPKKVKNNLNYMETKKPRKVVEPPARRQPEQGYGEGQYYNQPQQQYPPHYQGQQQYPSNYGQQQYSQNYYGQQGQYVQGYEPQQQQQYPSLYPNGKPDYGYSQRPPEQGRQAASDNPYFALNQSAPLIFRTKHDPSILIYEYADRVEVYRQSGSGLSLVSVQAK